VNRNQLVGKGKKIIGMSDPTGVLEGTIAEQIVRDDQALTAALKNKKAFCLDWEKLSKQQNRTRSRGR
jgi:hypothetical protein